MADRRTITISIEVEDLDPSSPVEVRVVSWLDNALETLREDFAIQAVERRVSLGEVALSFPDHREDVERGLRGGD